MNKSNNFFSTWRQDSQSSLVVFLVALPLCLGIALASNAPLVSGLYAGIIGGIVIGFLSGSHLSVSGPAAGLTVIVVNAIAELGSFEAFTLAVMISGFIQILVGICKGGSIGDYFPSSVIKGMLAAIGIILILKQLPHAVGYDADFMGDESFIERGGENTFTRLMLMFSRFHYGAIIISLISFAIMIGWDVGASKGKKFFQIVPGALTAVVTAVILNELFRTAMPDLHLLNDHLVALPFEGGVAEFIGGFNFPNFSFLSDSKVYVVAATIAIVGSLESLLSVDAADKIDPSGRHTSKNRELIAQGVGNSLSGFIGGLPVTAVIVRTSANFSAGAKSKLSAMLHGVWLMACVILIPQLLNKIPLSVLAAVLILVGFKLAKPKLIKDMYHKGLSQFIPFAVTIVAILLTDLLVGILTGIVVGFIFVFKSNIHKSIVMVNDGNDYLIRFYKDVSFLQKPRLLHMLNKVPNGAKLFIDGSATVHVDADIEDLIEDFSKKAKASDITLTLKKSSLALSPLFKE